nr:hypothetical protein [Brevundimonas diminuta]
MTADLSAIIARLEAAEVGSRELDVAIARSLGWGVHNARRFGLWVVPFGEYDTCDPDDMFELGEFTTSLDAAHALAERVLEGWTWDVGRHSNGLYRAGLYKPKSSFMVATSDKSAPALALCISILRAKQGEG